jgi:ATP-dependent DNA ligase
LITRTSRPGLQYNQPTFGDGEIAFHKIYQLGLEGIVSKRRGSAYKSGQCRDRLKSKNPASAAVRREAEEEWGRSAGTIRRTAFESPRDISGSRSVSCLLG